MNKLTTNFLICATVTVLVVLAASVLTSQAGTYYYGAPRVSTINKIGDDTYLVGLSFSNVNFVGRYQGNLPDYVKVGSRVAAFYETHPENVITSFDTVAALDRALLLNTIIAGTAIGVVVLLVYPGSWLEKKITDWRKTGRRKHEN